MPLNSYRRLLLSLFLLAGAATCGRRRADISDRPPAGSQFLAADRQAIEPPAALLDDLDVRPGLVVADLGAGSGYLALPLGAAVRPGGHVIALDVAADYLATLTSRARAAGLDDIETRVVLADDPGLGRGTIDRALLLHVVAYLPSPSQTLARLAAALRPGGRIVVADTSGLHATILAAARAVALVVVKDGDARLPVDALIVLVPASRASDP